MRKGFFLLYGLAAYALFLVTTLCTIGFVADGGVPISVDGPRAATNGLSLAASIALDVLLVAVFAVQHSVMARPAFKRQWTRLVPPALERSTYVVAASLALLLLFWQWRPLPEPVLWEFTSPGVRALMAGLFWAGWAVVLGSSFLIDHFELFGLAQVWAPLRGGPAATPVFRTPLLYRVVRHPLYLGLLLAFWATPRMSAGHLLFAALMSGYILVGIAFEERDLIAQFGDTYRRYREQVGMLLPRMGRGAVGHADPQRGRNATPGA